ncbi:hypothetical protein pEaSNUABM40_00227 [Erwinia phage pEa_SNUABM_40]|uniref:Uncharacterized protein n=1 Tax=Erwinia phage pEa_SNUABM_3 TaxID=2869552 RepID=A0AAE7XHG5_9CAUD|nr:hypothetical protein MPK68_gp224 [Erwinia phage pEa_SNUABM_3]QZE56759.1 hypothetical protein pEaSNUABM20_00223 [Erwinia phage pEa_SNUABM_20]QZE58443.1 hypothetical protein pEaSNUABM40_00227 [Erwinia phage pEa_SNUABM_40]UAW53004.1 hypothetical protein pEaSNUABM23_00222 [Erwinia phage pEa_SNUABM_23]UIW10900.1 hypothetical protein pEaSNUABM23_00222 [Erwinia phage pEa_SNUABM_31]QZE56421.1 hypothetical protein pEaSNUABM3_00224 [Erwinia phage pEa_SNUABM_3]
MKQELLNKLAFDVLSEFGVAMFLDRGEVGYNNESYATFETLFSVKSDADGSTLAADLRAKIAEHLEKLKAEGMTRNYNGNTQRMAVVVESPKLTYREPMANEIPGAMLYSFSIGFPLILAN